MQAISSSQRFVGAYDSDELIGCGRIVTDGILYAMIHDLIVLPSYRKLGLGTQILDALVRWCLDQGIRDIQLCCAKGLVGFYEERGFEARPADAPGMQYLRT
jgi:GNAT superfamily N-acetyltransferase